MLFLAWQAAGQKACLMASLQPRWNVEYKQEGGIKMGKDCVDGKAKKKKKILEMKE